MATYHEPSSESEKKVALTWLQVSNIKFYVNYFPVVLFLCSEYVKWKLEQKCSRCKSIVKSCAADGAG